MVEWRISTLNDTYALCGTHPRNLLVPACIHDAELQLRSVVCVG